MLPNGQIVSGSYDETLIVWDASDAQGLARTLIARGADVSKDAGGRTSLLVATGDADLVKSLLDGGADVSKAGTDGRTPLLAAVERRMGELAPRIRRLGFDGALTVREFRSGSVARKGAAAAAAS